MPLNDYVTPDQIQSLATEIKDHLSQQHELELLVYDAEYELELKKSDYASDPGFVPEKNLSFQELKYMSLFREQYDRIHDLKKKLKKVNDELEELREIMKKDRYIIDYFQVLS